MDSGGIPVPMVHFRVSPIGLDFATQVFAICAAHRSVYFLAREPLEGLVEKDCNIMVSNYLVSYPTSRNR